MKNVRPAQLDLVELVDDEVKAGVNPQPTPSEEPAAPCGAVAATVRPDDGITEFDWNADNDAVILKEQRATAVYRNKQGEVIIRQQAGWDQDEDTFIYITPENFNTFLDGLAKRWRDS